MAADGEKQMAVDTGRPATALATYVALRTMLCRVLEREGHPTACVLNAPCAEGGDFDR